MKNTPIVSANNAKINPSPIVNVGDLINKAKAENPDTIKEPTSYPAPTPEETEASQPTPEPQTMAIVRTRSRSEEIDYHVEKSRKMQLINTQLLSLKAKRDELKSFSFSVEKDEDYRYGRIVIYDDANREFAAKNHGLAAIVVEELKKLFEQKIEEKETELLTLAKS